MGGFFDNEVENHLRALGKGEGGTGGTPRPKSLVLGARTLDSSYRVDLRWLCASQDDLVLR